MPSVQAGVLVLAVVLIYLPAWFAGTTWDDDLLVFGNPCMIGWTGLVKIWTTQAADICPLTISTFWLEHLLWDKIAAPYHIVNILLHASCAVVLWRVLLSLRIPGAWLGAALWAFHPLQVQSVAWISEMKNTESGLFYLLSILFFVRWKQGPVSSQATGVRSPYGLCLLFAALAMASKSSTVVLPLVLILCAWRMEGRWQWRNLVSVVPVLAMSVLASLLSIWTQGLLLAGDFDPRWVRTWPQRIVAAGDAIWFYLGKLAWPYPLMSIYPRWSLHGGDPLAYLPVAAVLGVLFFLWMKRNSRLRPVFLAFAYFVVVLSPGLGLADNPIFRFSLVFDHLQYLAGIGPLALLAAGLSQLKLQTRFFRPEWITVAGTAMLIILGLVSWQRAWVYQDAKSFWTDVIAKNPAAWISYNNLGNILEQEGDYAGALAQYQKALALNSRFVDAYNNIGFLYIQSGRADQGIAETQLALNINPKSASGHNNIGTALLGKGEVGPAIAQFQSALATDPDFASAHNNLATAYNRQGREEDALRESGQAVALEPDSAAYLDTYSVALLHEQQYDEAIRACQEGLSLDPRMADLHNNLGFAYVKKGQFNEAAEQFQAALQIDPSDKLALRNLTLLQQAMQGGTR